jgi:hypothetical protein
MALVNHSNAARHYDATATRDGRWWLIEVPGIGATQARNLADAEDQARDLIAAVLDVDIDDVAVEVVPDLGDQVLAEVSEVRNQVAHAAEASRAAAEGNRALAARLVSELQLSGKDAAAVLGVSPQRVSQLLKQSEHANG